MLPTVVVRVPFADRIAALFDCDRVEVRRAFPQLLAVIQASALLHYRLRQTASDGALLAADTDYQIARRLISKSFAQSLGGGVSDSAMRFFDQLKELFPYGFSTSEAKKEIKVGKSSAYSWLNELHEAGALEQIDPPQGNKPARWKLTGTEPVGGTAVIPSVEDIFTEYRNPGNNTQPDD